MEKGLRKRGFMNEDRISELPEGLLLDILSSLPTKDVIATSALSKRWRPLWKMVPRLELVSPNQNFAENVSRYLLSNKAPVLESLHLKFRDTCDYLWFGDTSAYPYIGDIGAWAGIAFSRHVRELVFDVYLSFEVLVRLPSSLLCCDTLETLKLKHSIHVDVPSPVSMKSLRTLHLEYVTFKDDESIRNLLYGCPNLEHLLVHRRYHNYVKNFVIVAPSLKRLSIKSYTGGHSTGGYVINAPSLRCLNIERLEGYEFCLIENACELVEANIRNVSKIANEKILESLKSVKRLSLDLSPLEIKCPAGTIFYQLVYLEMHTHRVDWWNLLTLMLEISPKLQVLKLIDCWSHQQHWDYSRDSCLSSNKWSEPKHVPQCLLSHLETFVWKRYDWRREEEKEVATYILRNAIQLKKATFSFRPIEEFNELKERLKMLKELNRVVRVSNSCQFVFEFE